MYQRVLKKAVTVTICKALISLTLRQYAMLSGLQFPVGEKWERRKDLRGQHLKISVLPDGLSFTYDMGFVNPRGMGHDIITILSRILYFTFNYVEPIDGSYGFKENNDTNYNGIIGMLQR